MFRLAIALADRIRQGMWAFALSALAEIFIPFAAFPEKEPGETILGFSRKNE